MAEKPVYAPGTILVVGTWDGKHDAVYFFRIDKRRTNGNYIATRIRPEIIDMPEFTTCEGYKKRCVLPDTVPDGPQANLRWYPSKQVFSFQPMMPGFGLTYNEIYDPEKTYYLQAS